MSRQVCRGHHCLHHFFNNKCITRKGLTLKNESQCQNTTFAMVPFDDKLQPKSRIWAFFAASDHLWDIHISKFVTLKMYVTIVKYYIRTGSVMPFDGNHLTSYLMAIVMFALSLTVYEIFANEIMPKVWPWNWRLRSRKRKTEVLFDWKCSILHR